MMIMIMMMTFLQCEEFVDFDSTPLMMCNNCSLESFLIVELFFFFWFFFFRILLGGLDWPGCAQCRLPTPGIHFVRNCLFRSSLRRCLSPAGTLKLSQFCTFFSLFFGVQTSGCTYLFSCERVNNILLKIGLASWLVFFFFFWGERIVVVEMFSRCVISMHHDLDLIPFWYQLFNIILFLWFW